MLPGPPALGYSTRQGVKMFSLDFLHETYHQGHVFTEISVGYTLPHTVSLSAWLYSIPAGARIQCVSRPWGGHHCSSSLSSPYTIRVGRVCCRPTWLPVVHWRNSGHVHPRCDYSTSNAYKYHHWWYTVSKSRRKNSYLVEGHSWWSVLSVPGPPKVWRAER